MGKLAYLSITKIRVSLNKRAKPVPKKIFSFGASKACCSLLSPLPLSPSLLPSSPKKWAERSGGLKPLLQWQAFSFLL
jgi:hypothetical protein